MDRKPLEILPWGRDASDQEKLDRKKRAGHRGAKGCLFMLVAVALFLTYAAGWMSGHAG